MESARSLFYINVVIAIVGGRVDSNKIADGLIDVAHQLVITVSHVVLRCHITAEHTDPQLPASVTVFKAFACSCADGHAIGHRDRVTIVTIGHSTGVRRIVRISA